MNTVVYIICPGLSLSYEKALYVFSCSLFTFTPCQHHTTLNLKEDSQATTVAATESQAWLSLRVSWSIATRWGSPTPSHVCILCSSLMIIDLTLSLFQSIDCCRCPHVKCYGPPTWTSHHPVDQVRQKRRFEAI